MDLRPYIKTKVQLQEGVRLIRDRDLFYQPFILADDVEVGEGQNLHDKYKGVTQIWDYNAYAPHHDVGERKQPEDPAWFRKCNQEYRSIYDYIADQICARIDGPISRYSVGEIGCNTGLNLFNMAVRGAKSCHGYDWNDMNPTFKWLNGLLDTKVQFTQGNYDNLYHQFKDGVEVEEVDIMVNTVFTNHQCDPLQFLCYMADRARHGIFLWALIHSGLQDPCILYPPEIPHDILDKGRPFPLYFYNGIVVSEPLLRLSLRCLGFEELQLVEKFVPSPSWDNFQEGFRMYYAKRTQDVKSAYWGNKPTFKARPRRWL